MEESLDRISTKQLLRKIFLESPFPMWVSDSEGTLIMINNENCELFNISRGDVIGKYNILKDNNLKDAGLISTIQKVYQKGEKVNFEVEYDSATSNQFAFLERRKTKQVILDVTIIPILNENHSVTNAIIEQIDITKGKQTKNALKASEQKYHSLIHKMLNGFAHHKIIFNENNEPVNFRFLEINENYTILTGKTREEVEGKLVTEVYPNIKKDPNFNWIEEYAEVVITGKPKRFSRYFLDLDNWFDISVYSNEKGYFATVFDNITDQVLAKKRLKESETKYRQLFSDSTIPLTKTSLDGKLLEYNQAFLNTFGFSVDDDLDNLNVRDFYHDKSDRNRLINILKEKGKYRDDLKLKKKNGEVFWVDMHSRIYTNEEDSIEYIMSSFLDISKLKQLEVQLKTLNEELEEKVKKRTEELEKLHDQLATQERMVTIGRLSGGLSHEYNNILSIILGAAELVYDNTNDPQTKKYLEIILNQCEIGSEYARQMLDFSKQAQYTPEIFDLRQAIDNFIRVLEFTLPESISVEYKVENIPIFVDYNQFQQILINLCLNSIDAIKDEGTIFIKCERISADKIIDIEGISINKNKDYVHIKVEDNGEGMNYVVLSQALNPFFTTKEPGKGTGLGLSQVYGIVRLANGYINIESEAGKGTTVHLYFPKY